MKTKSKPGMRHSRTPWAAKLKPEMQPKVGIDPKGRGKILVPTPMLVAEEIRSVPVGSLITPSAIRARLAERFHADLTCPLCTGIFFNIVAGAAEDQLKADEEPLAPYWRVVMEDGALSPKTPPGPERQAELLRREGHVVEKRRNKLRVRDYARQK